MEIKKQIQICDLPAPFWPQAYYPEKKIDRSEKTVAAYIAEKNIVWGPKPQGADIFLRKAEPLSANALGVEREKKEQLLARERPTITLIAEPYEGAPLAYMYADKDLTLAVAPGADFKRMFSPSEWADPQLEDWKSREDRFCWIGRPTAERIATAKQLIESGLPLDIYSDRPWPLPQWRGRADDDVAMGRKYKYRIVYESSLEFACHSEKLFTGMKSGCVCYYLGDPELDLSFAKDCFLPLNDQALAQRDELAPKVLKNLNTFMFSPAWEIYSYREFYNRILALIPAALAKFNP